MQIAREGLKRSETKGVEVSSRLGTHELVYDSHGGKFDLRLIKWKRTLYWSLGFPVKIIRPSS